MAAGIEVAALLSEIWAASVAVFSQDLSTPDLVLSCGVEWAVPGSFPWERSCCVLLSVLTVASATPLRQCLRPPGLSLCS